MPGFIMKKIHNTMGYGREMNSTDYLDRLLLKYSGTFDIYQPYVILGNEYPAYGYFFSHVEKYLLTRDVNMWSSDSYEHVLFANPEELTESDLGAYRTAITEYIEPKLVRKGEKLPAANHMYSYITIASTINNNALTLIPSYKFFVLVQNAFNILNPGILPLLSVS